MNRDQFVNAMLTDFNVVSDYFNDPAGTVARFGMSAKESAAFVARDLDALARLGIDGDLVSAALSGAHSKTCPIPV
ncbi:hypothetical protein H8R18_06370 [Nanchangia anserum]|uniref:Uncharacterized protein n=1 Tax=Nanchangia anserum TaxID=2692125 RepID=A0A8I0GE22_9ACTO|nr:hypothetical protein [Nanchangia anserum]MBD3689157.1 hypothetical protein [Nanchangia anserum]QOX81389.1 hypothetical protein H8R18_06370 [Nanchangia anserum]